MKSSVVVFILCAFCISYGSCADPTDNPECQSFADIINEIKKNFDRIPLNLLPIPGLDTTKPTTLQCYEFANCTGFNCSGQVYGTHIQFSFDMDYCAKPIKAYLTLNYPSENVNFTRTITHSQEFLITKFEFQVPSTQIKIPVELYGKIDMLRSPGRVMVTAGIVPKFNFIFPLKLQPFNLINNQVIRVDTTKCGDEPPPTTRPTPKPTTRSTTRPTTRPVNPTTRPVNPTTRLLTTSTSTQSGTPAMTSTTMRSTATNKGSSKPTTSTMGGGTISGSATNKASIKSTTGAMKGTIMPGNTTGSISATHGIVTGQAQTGNGALTGGEIAAIVMSIVAFVAIVVAVMLYFRKARTVRRRGHTFRNEDTNDKEKAADF